VDVALWDIKGKALNTPVYNLLGGKSREGVMVYGHANGKDIDHALEDVATPQGTGLQGVRVQSGFAGLSTTYGISEKGRKYEPADAGCHRSTSGRPSFTCDTFQAFCARARGIW